MKTEVVIIGTLHHFHAQARGFGFPELAAAIQATSPDLLALELTAEELTSRRPLRVRQEYHEAVYPLMDRSGVPAVPLVPSSAEVERLVAQEAEVQARVAREQPAQFAEVRASAEQMLSDLLRTCTGPLSINSPATDRRVSEKHALQDRLYPPEQAAIWERLNSLLLEQLLLAASSRRCKRVAVVVGVEHCYWLRERLSNNPALLHRHLAEFLP